ncbi:MAG: hypothetical protein K6L76_01850 [Agarilytica sp.]
MSFLSALFGCNDKTIDIKGPNHETGKVTVVHLDETARIEYALPGNISKQFDVDSIREQDEKTKTFDLGTLQNEDFEQDGWRSKRFIDAGRWDYLGPKNEGLAGELGWLNLTLELNKSELADFSEKGIQDNIKASFLKNLEVANEEIRSHYPGYSEDNLAHVLLPPPESFDWVDVNGTRMLTWLSNESKGSPKAYYVLPLNQNYFVSIIVSHHTSVNDDKLLKQITRRIQSDISQILGAFVIKMQ